MKLEMFRRMVLLFCFHSFCVGSFNESDYDDAENCIRMCCELEPDGSSCKTLKESENFEEFRFFTFPEVSIKFGTPCEKMLPVDDDEWFYEVNELKLKVLWTLIMSIIQLKNGKIRSESFDDLLNISSYCLHLTTDNNDTGAHLFICDELSNGDIEKQLHKSLVRVIGETNSFYIMMVQMGVNV